MSWNNEEDTHNCIWIHLQNFQTKWKVVEILLKIIHTVFNWRCHTSAFV